MFLPDASRGQKKATDSPRTEEEMVLSPHGVSMEPWPFTRKASAFQPLGRLSSSLLSLLMKLLFRFQSFGVGVETESHYVALADLALPLWARLALNSELHLFFTFEVLGLRACMAKPRAPLQALKRKLSFPL